MPAPLLTDDQIWQRADRFDPAMRKVLRRVGDQPGGVLPRARGVSRTEEEALTRLINDGMVEPAYAGSAVVPNQWAMNANGEQALAYLDTPSTAHEEGPPDTNQ